MTVNDFIVRLDNRNTAFDGIYRPASDLLEYRNLQKRVWSSLFGETNSSEHFRIACEIMLILRNSAVAPWEIQNDSRVTYDDDDLAAALVGMGSEITGDAHPLEFIVTPEVTSKQQWTVVYDGGGQMTSTDEDGKTKVVTGLVFPAATWVPFALSSGGRAQTLGEPPADATWIVTRNENYNSQINQSVARLESLGLDEVIQQLPKDLVNLYRLTPVLQGPLRVAAAAVGVVYGP